MHRITVAVGALAVAASAAVFATASTSAPQPVKIFDSGNIGGVENDPANPTIFRTTKP